MMYLVVISRCLFMTLIICVAVTVGMTSDQEEKSFKQTKNLLGYVFVRVFPVALVLYFIAYYCSVFL